MKKTTSIFLSLAVMLATGCSLIDNDDDIEYAAKDPVTIKLNTQQVETVESSNTFAFNMFDKVLANTDPDKNVIISPLSMSYALSMALNGASGETYTEMRDALELEGLSLDNINDSYNKLMDALLSVDSKVKISIANSVWVKEGFPLKQEFVKRLQDYYDAEANSFTISQESLNAINQWIEDKTNGMIKDMLKELNDNLLSLLINAIYFEGEWWSGFNAENTETEIFTTSSGNNIDVNMMKQTESFDLYVDTKFAMLELPYGQGNYVMDIILPNGNNLDSLLTVVTSENFSLWTNKLYPRETIVWLPRFKYEFNITINEILREMGMERAFTGTIADFSNMTDEDIYIGFVQHNAAIENYEKGTKAAAATVVGMEVTSLGPDPLPYFFNANHPFIYIIREISTNTVIFMGKVTNPE